MTSNERQERPEHIPQLQTVSGAYMDITNHNAEFTGGGALGRAILGLGSGQNTRIHDVLAKQASEGEMDAELQEVVHQDTFTRIGIKIAPFGAELHRSSGGRVAHAKLVPLVANTSLFTEFLSTVDPGDVAHDTNAVLLRDVVTTLDKIVHSKPRAETTLSATETPAINYVKEDTLRTFVAIAPHYQRLGLVNEENYPGYLETPRTATTILRQRKIKQFLESYGDLETAVKYWGMDVLPEYLEGRKYLKLHNWAFDPGRWHKEKGWLDFVRRMDSDERTRPLGIDVRQALAASLSSAIAEVDLIDSIHSDEELLARRRLYPDRELHPFEEVYFNPRYYDAERSRLAFERSQFVNVRNFLTGQPYDQEQFDLYTYWEG